MSKVDTDNFEFKDALAQYEGALARLEDELRQWRLYLLIIGFLLKRCDRIAEFPFLYKFINAVGPQEANQSVEELLSDEICLDVFIARDQLQNYLSEQDPSYSKFLPQLSQLDQRLKKQIKAISQMFPLSEWRKLRTISDVAWWWQGEDPDVVHPWDRLDWLWEALTIPTLTINFALVVSISSRFLAGGPDAFGAIAIVGQSVVAMLAAGAPLTQTGQKIIDQGLQACGLPKYLWHEAKLGIAVATLLSLLGLQTSLPGIARFYVKRGLEERYDKYQATAALKDYKRAIELDPNNMEAHYRLGAIYEDLLDFSQADSEYRVAILGGCLEAINNLSRLYILEDNADDAAAVLSKVGRQNAKPCTNVDSDSLEYALSKNLGWARFKQERYVEARNALEAAIELRSDQSAPYCLLAQVIEDESEDESNAEALKAWSKCLDFALDPLPEEDEWLYEAEQRLNKSQSD